MRMLLALLAKAVAAKAMGIKPAGFAGGGGGGAKSGAPKGPSKAAAMFGGLFLVLSDTLARTVMAPRQLPVGVVTALLGVPLFLLLLNRARVRQ